MWDLGGKIIRERRGLNGRSRSKDMVLTWTAHIYTYGDHHKWRKYPSREKKKRVKKESVAAGNRAQVSTATTWGTNHYTTATPLLNLTQCTLLYKKYPYVFCLTFMCNKMWASCHLSSSVLITKTTLCNSYWQTHPPSTIH